MADKKVTLRAVVDALGVQRSLPVLLKYLPHKDVFTIRELAEAIERETGVLPSQANFHSVAKQYLEGTGDYVKQGNHGAQLYRRNAKVVKVEDVDA